MEQPQLPPHHWYGSLQVEMVERVARTLCRAGGLPEDEIDHGQPMWRSYEALARTVLMSMREPSLQMLTVPGFDWKIAALYWHAMIDAALPPSAPI